MSERKTSQYFKYAIGEIFLVVVGILIAFSINNWKDSIKRSNAELAALKEIQAGLKRDSTEIWRSIATLQRAESGIKETQKYLDNQKVNIDSIGFNFGWTLFQSSFETSMAPYENLKNQGLELINSPEVRASVISYYEQNSWVVDVSDGIFLELNDFRKQSALHFENIAYFDNISKNSAKIRWMMPRNLKNLQKDNLYRTYLNTRLTDIETMIHFTYETVQERIEEFKSKIDQQISEIE